MSSFKQSFPRKWFFEKRDWIVSDEVEDETEEMTEEELVAEEEVNLQHFLFFEFLNLQHFLFFELLNLQYFLFFQFLNLQNFLLLGIFVKSFFPQMVIPTVAVEADKKENTVCPVCREEFATFYKQVGLYSSPFGLVSYIVVSSGRGRG